MEINLSDPSIPDNFAVFLGGAEVTAKDGDWLLIPADDLSTLRIENQLRYSGSFQLTFRATLRDNGVLASQSDPEIVTVDVLPIAQCATTSPTIADEDQGVIFWGSEFNSSFNPIDRGNGLGNNAETETVIEMQIVVPADTPADPDPPFTYTVEDSTFGPLSVDGQTTSGVGTAEITYNIDANSVRTFTIRSTNANVAAGGASDPNDLVLLDQATRDAIEDDIRATLALFELSLGPNHTDVDGAIVFNYAMADVNLDVNGGSGSASINNACTSTNTLRVRAIADEPSLNIIEPTPAKGLEDAENIPLCFEALASADNGDFDNSEVLSVRITVPFAEIIRPVADNTAIGSIVYNGTLPDGVNITYEDPANGVWLIEADVPAPNASTPTTRQDLLNSVLCADPLNPTTSLLQFDPREGFAGSADLIIEAITTERATGSQVLEPTASVNSTIRIAVDPVADTPTVESKGNAIGDEDVSVDLQPKDKKIQDNLTAVFFSFPDTNTCSYRGNSQ